jgi:hypothetical protein
MRTLHRLVRMKHANATGLFITMQLSLSSGICKPCRHQACTNPALPQETSPHHIILTQLPTPHRAPAPTGSYTQCAFGQIASMHGAKALQALALYHAHVNSRRPSPPAGTSPATPSRQLLQAAS